MGTLQASALLVVLIFGLSFLLPLLFLDSAYATLQLSCYAFNVGIFASAIHSALVPSLALLWSIYVFDYDRYKWRERRLYDLSCRTRRRLVFPPFSQPEGVPPQWDSVTPPDYSPLDVSTFVSSEFDRTWCHTPDFLDLLTTHFICPESGEFCGLLDKSAIDIYMFHDSDNLIVFDTGASVC